MRNGSDILNEFLKLEYGGPLPREGALAFFYESTVESGAIFYLRGGERFHVFYADYESSIEPLDAAGYGWHAEDGAEICTLTLIHEVEGSQFNIFIILSKRDPENREFLKQLKETRTVIIHYLALLYGELYKSKSIEYAIPERLLQL